MRSLVCSLIVMTSAASDPKDFPEAPELVIAMVVHDNARHEILHSVGFLASSGTEAVYRSLVCDTDSHM